MATTKIRSSSIEDGQVSNADLSATIAVTGGQIADDAVTLAKMAGGTDGNLITYDASGDPAYVATGSATNVLTSNGAGAAPTFQAAAAGFTDIQKIQEVVASGDTNINFDNTKITSTYSTYEIRYFNVVPSVDDEKLQMHFSDDNGSNFDSNHTGGFFSTWTGSASAGSTYETANDSVSDSFQKLAAGLSFDAGDGAGGIVTIQNPSSASFITTYQGAESHIAPDATTRNYTTYIGGMWDSLAAVNYIRFDMTSGNIATGTFQLWGYV